MGRNLVQKMSVREVLSQAQYAEVAYGNVRVKGTSNTIVTFSSIHSFLTHAGMLSKLLWSKKLKDPSTGKILAKTLNLPDDLKIKDRRFRNILEHYDEYLKEWVDNKGGRVTIMDNCIGPKNAVHIPNSLWVRHYEPGTNIFTLLDTDLNLEELHKEVVLIIDKAIGWLNPKIKWDDLDDDEKQDTDEDRLLEELSDDFESDPDDTLERAENLGYTKDDLI